VSGVAANDFQVNAMWREAFQMAIESVINNVAGVDASAVAITSVNWVASIPSTTVLRVDLLFPNPTVSGAVASVTSALQNDASVLVEVRASLRPNPPLDGVTAVSASSIVLIDGSGGGATSGPTTAPNSGPASSSGGGDSSTSTSDVIIVAVVLAVSRLIHPAENIFQWTVFGRRPSISHMIRHSSFFCILVFIPPCYVYSSHSDLDNKAQQHIVMAAHTRTPTFQNDRCSCTETLLQVLAGVVLVAALLFHRQHNKASGPSDTHVIVNNAARFGAGSGTTSMEAGNGASSLAFLPLPM
jgi:hypothetical protein